MGMDYCYGCMEPLDQKNVICPLCGYDNSYIHNGDMLLREGTILKGRYLLGRRLGKGGFGVTYLGLDLDRKIKVAVKEYFPNGLSTRSSKSKKVEILTASDDDTIRYQKGRDAFQNEAKILKKFDSPGIVHVVDFFSENDTAYIVMDYVDGVGLNEEIKQKGRIPWERVVSLMLPLMPELNKLHEKNLIHRDIKPDNIKIVLDKDTGKERLVLLDFGAARTYVSAELTGNYSLILTPGFAPLEQHRRRSHQGPYTDVYALCATMYKAITGDTPPDSLDIKEGDDRLKSFSDYGLDVPAEVEQAFRHGMELNAEDRPQTMYDLYVEMSRAAAKDKKYIEYCEKENNETRVDLPNAEKLKMSLYSSAKRAMNEHTEEGFERALRAFRGIPGYKDADELAEKCEQELSNFRIKETKQVNVAELNAILEKRKKEEQKSINRKLILLAILAAVCVAFVIFFVSRARNKQPGPNVVYTAVKTAEPAGTDMPAPTVVPTKTPTFIPSKTAAVVPSDTPTAVPTDTPTGVPSRTPTRIPSKTPAPVNTDVPVGFEEDDDLVIIPRYGGKATDTPEAVVMTADEQMAASFDCRFVMGVYNRRTNVLNDYSKDTYSLHDLETDQEFVPMLLLTNKTAKALTPKVSFTLNGQSSSWNDMEIVAQGSLRDYAIDFMKEAGTYHF
ncbi:MAG: protein kinase, partial [Anaerolineaceae bacterium]|nr:protein kinase [Anaerolineaceae bacterium]